MPDKRAGNPGCRRNQKSCKIYAWDKSSANLWRTGDCKTDSFSEKWHTACDRNTGTCDGSYAPQNYEMDHVHTIVLDEADEMLNMGFREDIETILEGIPQEHQTVLFSATMPKAILEITKQFQTNAELVKVTKKELTVPNIEQFYYEVKPKNKEEVLSRLLDIYTPKLSVVFCNTKKQVDLLVNGLLGRGYFAAGLHGDMKQAQRDRVMQGFRSGKTDILVCTDVAARGIDVDDVEAVFNYDLPQDDEYYVHRIGRTGRAGRVGRSFSFVSGREVYKLKEIQRYCKTKIYAQKVPSLNDVANTKMENVLEEN